MIQVRKHTYRRNEGFLVCGRDGFNRSIKIFVRRHETAKAIQLVYKTKYDANEIDRLIRFENAARLNWHDKSVTVLCPNGHVVTSIQFDRNFAGSMAEAELGSRQAGRINLYDQLARRCAEQDLKELGALLT